MFYNVFLVNLNINYKIIKIRMCSNSIKCIRYNYILLYIEKFKYFILKVF